MKRTVLVIDDDKMILDMIQGVLADKFDVSAVNDGQKAFRVLERVRPDIMEASSHNPDIILLDLKMPGMDGYDVISRLKVNQEYKNIPVIFLTAVTDEYSETKCFEAGAEDYICKPFTANALTARIERVLNIQDCVLS